MLREGEIEDKYKTPAGGILLRVFNLRYLVNVVHGVVDVEFIRWGDWALVLDNFSQLAGFVIRQDKVFPLKPCI